MTLCKVELPLTEKGYWEGYELVCIIGEESEEINKEIGAPSKHVRILIEQPGWLWTARKEKFYSLDEWKHQKNEKHLRVDLRKKDGFKNYYKVKITLIVDHAIIGTTSAIYFNEKDDSLLNKELKAIQQAKFTKSKVDIEKRNTPETVEEKKDKEIQRLKKLVREYEKQMAQLTEELLQLKQPVEQTLSPTISFDHATKAPLESQSQDHEITTTFPPILETQIPPAPQQLETQLQQPETQSQQPENQLQQPENQLQQPETQLHQQQSPHTGEQTTLVLPSTLTTTQKRRGVFSWLFGYSS